MKRTIVMDFDTFTDDTGTEWVPRARFDELYVELETIERYAGPLPGWDGNWKSERRPIVPNIWRLAKGALNRFEDGS